MILSLIHYHFEVNMWHIVILILIQIGIGYYLFYSLSDEISIIEYNLVKSVKTDMELFKVQMQQRDIEINSLQSKFSMLNLQYQSLVDQLNTPQNDQKRP